VFTSGTQGQLATGASPIRIFSPVGVGFSGSGSSESLYVADQAPGVGIHKLDASGVQAVAPDYTAPYGFGEEPGAFDPLSPSDYYTYTRHLTFDTTKTKPGSEWSLKAVTWNPFDPRIAEMAVRPPATDTCAADCNPSAPDVYWDNRPTGRHNDVRADQKLANGRQPPILRHLPVTVGNGPPSGNPLFMYLPYTVANNRHLAIFRFEGEIAVPAGSFEFQLPSPSDPWNAAAALRLWIDTPTNPDGLRPAWPDTTETTVSTGSFSTMSGAGALDVDSNGNVWVTLGQWVWKFPLLGVTQATVNGVATYVPRYSLSSRVTYQMPSTLFGGIGFRVEATTGGASDTLYALVTHAAETDTQCGYSWDALLGAYDVSASVPSGTVLPIKYERSVPRFGVGVPDNYEYEVTDPECMFCTCAINDPQHCACGTKAACWRGSTDPACVCVQNPQTPGCECATNHDWGFNSLSVAGDYVFLGEQPGMINVRRKSDGSEVSHIYEGPEASGMVGFTSDMPETVKAVVASTGEYLVTRRDVSDLARMSVFRWTPPAYSPASLGPTAWYVASPLDVDLNNGKVSRWIDRSGHQHDLSVANPVGWPTFNAAGWNGTNPTVSFSGGNVLLTDWSGDPAGLDQPFTVLAVARSAVAQDASLVGFSHYARADSARCAFLPSGSATYATLGRDADTRQLWSAPFDVTNVGHVFAWRFASNSSLTVTVDDHVYPTSSQNFEVGWMYFTTLVLGARNANPNGMFTGDVSEVVVVPSALSDASVEQFRQYARGRWAGLP
jgi:hypothetical protein